MGKAFKCDRCEEFFDGDACIVGKNVNQERRVRLENKEGRYPSSFLFTVTVSADDKRELCDTCWFRVHEDVLKRAMEQFA